MALRDARGMPFLRAAPSTSPTNSDRRDGRGTGVGGVSMGDISTSSSPMLLRSRGTQETAGGGWRGAMGLTLPAACSSSDELSSSSPESSESEESTVCRGMTSSKNPRLSLRLGIVRRAQLGHSGGSSSPSRAWSGPRHETHRSWGSASAARSAHRHSAEITISKDAAILKNNGKE
ncbi:hypothetical protein DPEC_G00087620 [Dallia pectoralis]|uniref:Uncharacterized protein n=1 Tax=Dallia pectoralis TaxID=75939 RepID=A0ACC2H087_DALPE|nr:hypothetical protein DPEC_G00087620 [Dallia pectoralis]